jgi:outer membrane protein OmpA-like peptidoglycan-associated protein
MKTQHSIIAIIAAAVICISTISQAQFKNPKNAWALSVGGSHGHNISTDNWSMQYRGYFQHEVIPQRLLAQAGLGFIGLTAPGFYSLDIGSVDARALYTPFSLPNLNPYIYGGFGVAKVFRNGSAFLPMMSLGAGVQTKIANGVMIDINSGYSVVFSDKLDGLTRSDNNLNALTNGKHDGFYGFNLGVAFSLGGSDEEGNTQKEELEASEARRIKELAAAEAVRVKQQADAEALLVKELANAEAVRVKQKEDSDAAARLAKAAAEADARLLAAEKGRDTVITLVKGKSVVLRGINFEFNKATLMNESEIILRRALNALVANPSVMIVITGHTDNIGSKESNQILSLERAQTVRNWLVEHGIASNRLRTVGRGQNEPVASNETEEGQAMNRRIEFFVANNN